MSPPFRRHAAFAVTIAVALAAAGGVHAQTTGDPKLQEARELAPPAPKPAAAPAAASAAASATPRSPRTVSRPAAEDPDRGAIFLRADRLEGTTEKRIEAFGKVELRTRRETILADYLAYEVDADEVHGKGNVVMRRGVDWISGTEARFKRNEETGFFDEPHFFVGDAGARGDAKKLTFAGPDKYEVSDGRYTTCVAPRNDWYLTTRELTIDTMRMVGTAHDATVRFFDVPVFYSPWLEFPLTDERKSGFLTPTAGYTGTRGFEMALPYYLNLAENYDATVTPRLMTKRGLQVGGQFRYLFGGSQPMQGEFDGEVLPYDRVANATRWGVAWKHSQQVAPWAAMYWNINEVSDDTYFADLADRISVTSQTTLPREFGLNMTQGPWSLLTRVQAFQTLQDPNAPIVPPYNRLPQLLATFADTEYFGLNFAGAAEYARFRQPQLPEGDRAVLYPQVSWSTQGAAWFVTARGSVHMRRYDLDSVVYRDPHPTLAIPIASLDAGLIFERDWNLFGRNYINTLEPRAFYAYIPYKDQSLLPIFDTAQDDFNFSQLFSENRYLGNDRIGDANQLTLALSSRLLDPGTGVERLRVAIGQRFYFSDQRVTLSELPRSAQSSDVLLVAEGRLSDSWALAGLVQQNLDAGKNERLNLAVRYTPSPGRVLNGSYRYTRQQPDPINGTQTIHQFDLSGEWPINANWTLLGRWNYSIQDKKTLEAIAGVEYNQDCWVLRAVFHRLTTTTEQTTNSVFVQLELNGLARVGTSPLELLRRSVPGYIRTNDPALRRDTGYDPLPEF